MDKCDKSVLSTMKANTIKSILKTTKKFIKLVSALQKCDENGDEAPTTLSVREEGSSHFQDTLGNHEELHLKTVLAMKHRTYDRVDTTFVVSCSEKALPKLFLDMELFGKQQIYGAVQVRELLEKQGYSSRAECGPMSNPEEIPGCGDMPEDVAKRELVMQNSPSEIMEDR